MLFYFVGGLIFYNTKIEQFQKPNPKKYFITDPPKNAHADPKTLFLCQFLGKKTNRDLIAGKPERSNSFLSLARIKNLCVRSSPSLVSGGHPACSPTVPAQSSHG